MNASDQKLVILSLAMLNFLGLLLFALFASTEVMTDWFGPVMFFTVGLTVLLRSFQKNIS